MRSLLVKKKMGKEQLIQKMVYNYSKEKIGLARETDAPFFFCINIKDDTKDGRRGGT